MKNIEKEFLEDYSNSMKSTKNFDDISKHIDYSKYKKEIKLRFLLRDKDVVNNR